MFYWLPEGRTLFWWALVIGIIWFVIAQPARAGSDVSHFLHWLAWAAGRLAKFAESI